MKTYAIAVQISTVEGVGFRAECTGLQGCFVDGETLEEVISDIQDAASLYITSCQELGLPLPGPLELPDGTFITVIPVAVP